MADVTEMVERVAASIEDAMLAEAWLVEVLRGAGSPGKDVLRAAFERFARAAIKASKYQDVDEDACLAAMHRVGMHGAMIAEAHDALIDAALGESPER